jgi:hypothetical protein
MIGVWSSRLPLVPPSRLLPEDAQVNRRIENLDPTGLTSSGDSPRQQGPWVEQLVDQIASILAPDDPQLARGQTLSLFALLIGTLQLSRALSDLRLADEVLERGIENALALLPGT